MPAKANPTENHPDTTKTVYSQQNQAGATENELSDTADKLLKNSLTKTSENTKVSGNDEETCKVQ